jgi:predicted nucleic acid-binding protein
VKLYLDASVLVPLFTEEDTTEEVQTFLRQREPTLVVSDFAAAEFVSAIGRRVRTALLTRTEAQRIFATFDDWTAGVAVVEMTLTHDIARANALLRRLDLPLRTPDAINIAIAERIRAELFTLDKQMAANARQLHLKVARP